jgi:hypothetical protein
VDARVDVQPALVDKGFVALAAAVGADGDVKLQVLLQVALHREAFAAVGAHERVLVDVNPGVVLEKIMPGESLAAPVALVIEGRRRSVGIRVRPLMLPQVGHRGEIFAALCAQVGLEAQVALAVQAQQVPLLEYLQGRGETMRIRKVIYRN